MANSDPVDGEYNLAVEIAKVESEAGVAPIPADGAGVAGLADGADPLAGPDTVAAIDGRRAGQVGVEVAAPLGLAVDQQVVA